MTTYKKKVLPFRRELKSLYCPTRRNIIKITQKVHSYILTLSKNQISEAMLHFHFIKHTAFLNSPRH